MVIRVWCSSHPVTLELLTQPDLDAAMPMVTRAAFQLGRHVSHPINIQYLQRNYHVIKPASLVFALGYFDELRKHVLGGTGRSVAMAQLLLKPVCLIWIRNSSIGGIPPCNNINPVKA